MDLRIFKPLDWTTAVVEFWQDDRLVAEVFARHDGVRRLYISEDAAAWGIEWEAFNQLAPQVTALLDQADEEMRQVRQSLAES
jgi:hypothetical protein